MPKPGGAWKALWKGLKRLGEALGGQGRLERAAQAGGSLEGQMQIIEGKSKQNKQKTKVLKLTRFPSGGGRPWEAWDDWKGPGKACPSLEEPGRPSGKG